METEKRTGVKTGIKTTPLQVRLSEADHALIKKSAEEAGISIGEYVRRRCLGVPVIHRVDMETLAEMRRLGGLLKHLHNSGLGREEETANVLSLLGQAVLKIDKSLE